MSWNRGSFLGDDSEKSVVDLVKSFSKHESAQSEPWSFIERAMHVGLEKLAKDVKDKKQLWKIMS